jgi:hypothetical protein
MSNDKSPARGGAPENSKDAAAGSTFDGLTVPHLNDIGVL